ncbi:glutamate ABC transporter substrate-binding protein [Streptomyces sp. H10-C2]|uniref:glutamate ABC transporter substrate-binding protein n=1 Tax=unclassified Streptomyces TaxID=2593676 RepID=UPI0024BBD9E0|nr:MULTISPECIES: glutamate ABC transporter substrate-binding protein [unclassified Streptomyces]MDJ0341616.1 glutamate ABC transporter substrate-binding protein [Streptomyces sp. PH10-H1]MDJ0371282.1 glutamate ABC transporter substrate-binding protein [Streptomyces sp. H10-C2]
MKFRNSAAAGLVVLALTLTATACGGKSGTPSAPGATPTSGTNAPKLPTYTTKTGVTIDSAVLKRAQQRGKLIIGVKADQPFLGFQPPGTNDRNGFDIEIAKMVAADLGFGPDKIEWKTFDSSLRVPAIKKGDADYYVGTFTINDARKKDISFAGPYYIAGQDLLVAKDNTDITGPDSLKGKKVCSITGSTPLERIKDPKYGAIVNALGKYSDCVQQLQTGQVDAVTTDDAILKGYAAQAPGKFKVVGKTFSSEPYGVGLNKDDKALRDAISNALQAHEDNGDYKKAYDATLGLSGSPYKAPPALDRY